MSFSVALGLGLAVLTAFTSVAGFLYKFRGAREADGVDLKRPIRSSIRLFSSPLCTLGIVIAFGSWALHAGALALAPISVVQSVIAGGLVLLTIVADRLFGIAVTRRAVFGAPARLDYASPPGRKIPPPDQPPHNREQQQGSAPARGGRLDRWGLLGPELVRASG